MKLAIRTQHLTKMFDHRLIAVNDMNLSVPEGAIFGLLGPNGAGKTTTIRLLLGLQKATAGSAEVFGQRCGPNAIGVRRLIGYLPTNPKLPGSLRPTEYLDLVGQLYGLPREVRRPRLASLLRAVGLLDATGQQIKTFSTGMGTRLGIAASLIGNPPLLFWDEPTAGLDPAARRFTLNLIRKLGETRTIVVASHILSDIDQICDHVGVMHHGQMIFAGTMQAMKQRLHQEDFRIELEGAPEEIDSLLLKAEPIEGIRLKMQPDGSFMMRVVGSRSRSDALSEIMKLISDSPLALLSVCSGRNETEDAYLQLLQEDEAHGFYRFDLQRPFTSDAVSGDFPA